MSSLYNQLHMRAKLKQVVSFYQIATRIEQVYGVSMPSAVHELLAMLEFLNLNLAAIGCVIACCRPREPGRGWGVCQADGQCTRTTNAGSY